MIPPRLVQGLPAFQHGTRRSLDRIEAAREITTKAEAPYRIPYFTGQVVGFSQVDSDFRWTYTVNRVHARIGPSNSFEVHTPLEPNGDDPLYTTIAYNIAEWGNSALGAQGITIADLPGYFEPQPIPVGSLVHCFYVERYLAVGDTGEPQIVAFDRMNPWDGTCEAPSLVGGGPTPVQSFSGTWASQYQYGGTQVIGTKEVISLVAGSERWAANSIRFWNGAESANAGAVASGTQHAFATGPDCRAWWDNYVVRVNVNGEGWQYINPTNDGAVAVGGLAQAKYLNTSPAVTWSGADFYAGLAMDVEVYELATGGGP